MGGRRRFRLPRARRSPPSGSTDLAERAVDSLSGGERRRLDIATLLAQDAAVCLLDEPTNHLDPRHRNEMLAIFRARADAGGLVIAALHDPTLAARSADKVLLLFGDGRWRFGEAATILSDANLSELYEVPVGELAWQRPARVRQRLSTSAFTASRIVIVQRAVRGEDAAASRARSARPRDR